MIPASDLITMNLTASEIIHSGLKRTGDSAVLEQYCPMMDDVFRFAKAGMDFFSIPLDDRDRKVLSLVDGRARLADISRDSPYDETETIKTICALTGAGVMEPHGSEEAAEGPAQPGLVGEEAAAVGPRPGRPWPGSGRERGTSPWDAWGRPRGLFERPSQSARRRPDSTIFSG